jgi:hypothetical protein
MHFSTTIGVTIESDNLRRPASRRGTGGSLCLQKLRVGASLLPILLKLSKAHRQIFHAFFAILIHPMLYALRLEKIYVLAQLDYISCSSMSSTRPTMRLPRYV